MSENATETNPALNITIPRNDTEVVTGSSVFGKKSPNAGKSFPCPKWEVEQWDNLVQWLGKDNIVPLANSFVRGVSMEVYVNNVDEKTGVFDVEGYIEEMQDLSAEKESLGGLEDEIQKLSDKQSNLAAQDEIWNEVDAAGKPMTDRAVAAVQEMRSISAAISPLKVKKAEIEARYAAAAAKRKANKAAKKAGPVPVPQGEPVAA